MYTEKSVDPRRKVLAAIQAVLASELSTEVPESGTSSVASRFGK